MATLRHYREALGKRNSQDVVVYELQKLGYRSKKSTLSNYENGRPPDIGVLWGLAQIYKVPFAVLCDLIATELAGHAAHAPEPQPTTEAFRIARAYDSGPELLRTVLDGAVSLWTQRTPSNDQSSPEQSVEPQARGSGNRALGRKLRRRG